MFDMDAYIIIMMVTLFAFFYTCSILIKAFSNQSKTSSDGRYKESVALFLKAEDCLAVDDFKKFHALKDQAIILSKSINRVG